MTRILVAGIGNIFKGDDAFGVEVAQKLAKRAWPDGVRVVDFGIRGIDLTYALLDGCDTAILIDAAQRGEAPGTVTIVAPEPLAPDAVSPEDLMLQAHDLDPAKVLTMVTALGGDLGEVLLVACEPETLGDPEFGAMGLSPVVAQAIDKAAAAVERLVHERLPQTITSNRTSNRRQPGANSVLIEPKPGSNFF